MRPLFLCVNDLSPLPQEVFSAVRDRYMRDGEGFILVYSLTERATFTPIAKISEQIKRVKDTDMHIPIVLVGNKVRGQSLQCCGM